MKKVGKIVPDSDLSVSQIRVGVKKPDVHRYSQVAEVEER